MSLVLHALSALDRDIAFAIGPNGQPGINSWNSTKEAAAFSIRSSLFKRYKANFQDPQKSMALLKFLECNQRARNWSLALSSSYDEELWGEFRQEIYRFFHKATPNGPTPIVGSFLEVLDFGSMGPGASNGVDGKSFYEKLFGSQMTCTDIALYRKYKLWLTHRQTWRTAEETRRLHKGIDVVTGSRIDFVEKDETSARSICVEPSLNMFYQLGLGSIIESRLRSFYGIDLTCQQERNKWLARNGSITGRFATVDLSSASDSISMRFLEAVLPGWLMAYLREYRSPYITVSEAYGLEPDIVSTMGNGFTFPLQTAIFACMVNAAARCRTGRRPQKLSLVSKPIPLHRLAGCVDEYNLDRSLVYDAWGVFGDDIIVETEYVGDVLKLLALGGFIANPNKTFTEGPFRESCGGDYHKGVNIRGVRIKELKTQQDFFKAINRLNEFTARTGLGLFQLVSLLKSKCKYLPVPAWESDDAGVRVPMSFARPIYRSDALCGTWVYSKWASYGSKLTIEKILVLHGFTNPEGVLIAAIAMTLLGGKVALRKKPRYRLVQQPGPGWDTLRADCDVSWRHWEGALLTNLFDVRN